MKILNKIKVLRRIVKMKKFLKSFGGLMTICAVVFVALLIAVYCFIPDPNEFGDSAGAINGLFSALAFAGVIYTVFLQKKELSLQRQELVETRKEIAGQRKEAEAQNVTLKRQRFENTFFQMISLQQEIVKGLTVVENKHIPFKIDSPVEHRIISGRELFKFLFEDAKHYFGDEKLKGMHEVIAQKNMSGYEESHTPTYFDHYFRNLYRIIKFVDETDLLKCDNPTADFDTRYQYTSIVRGQLSRYELVWLFYNGLSCYGQEKFRPLIEKYALLKNIREDLLVRGRNDVELYEQRAFEKTYPNIVNR